MPMETAEIVQGLREQRLTTLALADQIGDDRWWEPVLPGEATLHDMLAHLLGWDEWATAVFEISVYRELPDVLVDAARDVDGYNARTQTRYRPLTRDDLLGGLQSATPRVITSAMGRGELGWETRRITQLTYEDVGGKRQEDGTIRPPSVRGILRLLLNHEREHGEQISAAFGVTANLERFSGGDETPQSGS
jgi:hypothetical protein